MKDTYSDKTLELYEKIYRNKGSFDFIYYQIMNRGLLFRFLESNDVKFIKDKYEKLQKHYISFKNSVNEVPILGGSILITYWIPISLILCIIVLLFLIYTIYATPKKYYNVRIKNEN